MIRFGRSAGDLEGIHTFKTLKLFSTKQLHRDPYAFNLASYSSKDDRHGVDPTCPEQALSAKTLQVETLQILKHYYLSKNLEYIKNTHQYIKASLESNDKKFQLQVNKLFYLRQSMHKKNYDQVQGYVYQEWKNNSLLTFLRNYWIKDIQKKYLCLDSGFTLKEFKEEYDIFRECVGQLIMLYFGQFFVISGKSEDKTLFKMINKTSHLIITHCSQWQKLYNKMICPLLQIQPKSHKLILQPSLKQLQISSSEIDKSFLMKIPSSIERPLFPKTAQKIQKLVCSYKLFDCIKLLIKIRKSLEQEIQQIQRKMIQIGSIKKFKILDKDDLIDCLLQCVKVGKIDVNSLEISVQYIKFMIGGGSSNLLNYYQCQAYLADLEAVKDYIIINMATSNKKLAD